MNVTAETVIGGQGYGSDVLVNHVQTRQTAVVIPPRAHRTQPRACDWPLYEERHRIECFFGKFKHDRRVFPRFEKTVRNYLADLQFSAFLVSARQMSTGPKAGGQLHAVKALIGRASVCAGPPP